MPNKVDYRTFSQRVKNKYPEYINMGDLELAQMWVNENPQYGEFVIFDQQPVKKKDQAEPSLGAQGGLQYASTGDPIADKAQAQSALKSYSQKKDKSEEIGFWENIGNNIINGSGRMWNDLTQTGYEFGMISRGVPIAGAQALGKTARPFKEDYKTKTRQEMGLLEESAAAFANSIPLMIGSIGLGGAAGVGARVAGTLPMFISGFQESGREAEELGITDPLDRLTFQTIGGTIEGASELIMPDASLIRPLRQRALKDLVRVGAKGLSKADAGRYVAEFTEKVAKEVGEEYAVEIGNVLRNASFAAVGYDKAAPEMKSARDYAVMTLSAALGAGTFAGVGTGVDAAFAKSTAIKKAAENPEAAAQAAADLVDAGKLTQEQADAFLAKVASVNKAISKMPDDVDPDVAVNTADLLNEKVGLEEMVKELEENKKRIDPTFHQGVDDRIAQITARINELTQQIAGFQAPTEQIAPEAPQMAPAEVSPEVGMEIPQPQESVLEGPKMPPLEDLEFDNIEFVEPVMTPVETQLVSEKKSPLIKETFQGVTRPRKKPGEVRAPLMEQVTEGGVFKAKLRDSKTGTEFIVEDPELSLDLAIAAQVRESGRTEFPQPAFLETFSEVVDSDPELQTLFPNISETGQPLSLEQRTVSLDGKKVTRNVAQRMQPLYAALEQRMNNAEEIPMSEIEAVVDQIIQLQQEIQNQKGKKTVRAANGVRQEFTPLTDEQKRIFNDFTDALVNKLLSYDFATTTTTGPTTQKTTTAGLIATPREGRPLLEAKVPRERLEGAEVTIEGRGRGIIAIKPLPGLGERSVYGITFEETGAEAPETISPTARETGTTPAAVGVEPQTEQDVRQETNAPQEGRGQGEDAAPVPQEEGRQEGQVTPLDVAQEGETPPATKRVRKTEQQKADEGRAALDKLKETLRTLRAKPGGGANIDLTFGVVPISKAVWNTALDTAILAIDAGQSIAQVIKDASDYISSKIDGDWGKAKFEQYMDDLLTEAKGMIRERVSYTPFPEGLALVDGWYSTIEKRIREAKQDKQSASAWLNSGLIGKGDEATYTSVRGWLEGKRPNEAVSKQEILDLMKDNRVEIVEVAKSEDAKEDSSLRAAYLSRINELNTNSYELEQQGRYSEAEEIQEEISRLIAENELNEPVQYSQYQPRYSEYQLEGEKRDYKELLITLPKEDPFIISKLSMFDTLNWAKNTYGVKSAEYNRVKQSAINELEEKGLPYESSNALFNQYESSSPAFMSGHFEEPNILVHLRMNTRTDSDGDKVLFLEEIQSDWGQTGKKQGFRITEQEISRLKELGYEYKDGEVGMMVNNTFVPRNYNDLVGEAAKIARKAQLGAPPAPFVTDTNAWTKLAVKVAMREAAKQGVDKIAWTTGEQQNERYDLSKQVDYITKNVDKINEDRSYVDISTTNGLITLITDNRVEPGKILEVRNQGTRNMVGKNIEDVVGKDVAKRIIDGKDGLRLEGEGLKIGGKGMKGFYDKIVPDAFKSVVKELTGQDAVIREITLDIPANYAVEQTTQQSVFLTPRLKRQIERGMPLFEGEKASVQQRAEKVRGEITKAAESIIPTQQQAQAETKPTRKAKTVFHAGTLEGKGNIYVSPIREQANEYSSMSGAPVLEFEINENAMAPESEVRDLIGSLGLKLPEGYSLDELFLYEALDTRVKSSLSQGDIDKLYTALKDKGYEGIAFRDEDIRGVKREGIDNFIVFDKSSLSEQQAQPEAKPEKTISEQRKEFREAAKKYFEGMKKMGVIFDAERNSAEDIAFIKALTKYIKLEIDNGMVTFKGFVEKTAGMIEDFNDASVKRLARDIWSKEVVKAYPKLYAKLQKAEKTLLEQEIARIRREKESKLSALLSPKALYLEQDGKLKKRRISMEAAELLSEMKKSVGNVKELGNEELIQYVDLGQQIFKTGRAEAIELRKANELQAKTNKEKTLLMITDNGKRESEVIESRKEGNEEVSALDVATEVLKDKVGSVIVEFSNGEVYVYFPNQIADFKSDMSKDGALNEVRTFRKVVTSDESGIKNNLIRRQMLSAMGSLNLLVELLKGKSKASIDWANNVNLWLSDGANDLRKNEGSFNRTDKENRLASFGKVVFSLNKKKQGGYVQWGNRIAKMNGKNINLLSAAGQKTPITKAITNDALLNYYSQILNPKMLSGGASRKINLDNNSINTVLQYMSLPENAQALDYVRLTSNHYENVRKKIIPILESQGYSTDNITRGKLDIDKAIEEDPTTGRFLRRAYDLLRLENDPNEALYFPSSVEPEKGTELDITTDDLMSPEANNQKALSALSNNLISTTEGGKLIAKGFSESIKDYNKSMANMIGKLGVLNNMRSSFNAENMKAMSNIFGKAYSDRFRERVRYYFTQIPAGYNGKALKAPEWFTIKTSLPMFFNRKSGILQTLQTLAFIPKFGFKNYYDGIRILQENGGIQTPRGMKYRIGLSREILQNELVQARIGARFDISVRDLNELVRGDDKSIVIGGVPFTLKKLLSVGYLYSTGGDLGSILTGGMPVYAKLRQDYINQYSKTMSAEEAGEKGVQKALTEFADIIDKTQQTSREDLLAAFETDPTSRLLLSFATIIPQSTRMAIVAGKRIQIGEGNIYDNVAQIAYFGLLSSVFFNLISQGLDDLFDPEEEDETNRRKKIEALKKISLDVIRDLTKSFGWIGVAAQATVVAAKKVDEGLERGSSGKQIATDVAIETVSMVPQISIIRRDMEGLGRAVDMDQMFKATTIGVQLVTNVPAENTRKMVQDFADIATQQYTISERLMRSIGILNETWAESKSFEDIWQGKPGARERLTPARISALRKIKVSEYRKTLDGFAEEYAEAKTQAEKDAIDSRAMSLIDKVFKAKDDGVGESNTLYDYYEKKLNYYLKPKDVRKVIDMNSEERKNYIEREYRSILKKDGEISADAYILNLYEYEAISQNEFDEIYIIINRELGR